MTEVGLSDASPVVHGNVISNPCINTGILEVECTDSVKRWMSCNVCFEESDGLGIIITAPVTCVTYRVNVTPDPINHALYVMLKQEMFDGVLMDTVPQFNGAYLFDDCVSIQYLDTEDAIVCIRVAIEK